MESDWQKFCALVPVLRERYLADRNAAVARIIGDPKRTETERFWDAKEVMEKEAKILRKCFDGHSRSKMWFYMITMRGEGLLKREDLANFSAEIQSRVFDDPFKEKG
jgi:hypothetical protein